MHCKGGGIPCTDPMKGKKTENGTVEMGEDQGEGWSYKEVRM